MEKSFCLITEPWIKAMDMNGSVRTFSLQDALTSAQDIQILSGEIANQDFAVLRFLLSIMQTVVYRYDENGNKSDITTASEALRRWDAIHKAGHFPGNAITDYLAEWNDYFWLIHPEHPFYQITKRLRTRDGKEKTGTSIDRGRLIGAISESDNKPRFHASYSTAGKASIDDGELTRWILYFQTTKLQKQRMRKVFRKRKNFIQEYAGVAILVRFMRKASICLKHLC